MGAIIEFNWILKLPKEQIPSNEELIIGKTYPFTKKDIRYYPLDVPIDLINHNWEAICKILIIEMKLSIGLTTGIFKIIRLFEQDEIKFLTKYWRETLQITKNTKIEDFSNTSIT